jgi:hypothetical protein
MNLIKMKIVHTSHQDIINRIDTSFIYKLYMYIYCAIYTLKPMDFAHTYCFMNFVRILLKFHDTRTL